MHRHGDKEYLDITAGFWEWAGESESRLTFKVDADLKEKTAHVGAKVWTLELTDWLEKILP